jgi:hypothetical protein
VAPFPPDLEKSFPLAPRASILQVPVLGTCQIILPFPSTLKNAVLSIQEDLDASVTIFLASDKDGPLGPVLTGVKVMFVTAVA